MCWLVFLLKKQDLKNEELERGNETNLPNLCPRIPIGKFSARGSEDRRDLEDTAEDTHVMA